jgi:hypothetical protein
MTEGEAKELIVERMRVLKIEKLVGDLAQLDLLLNATGGNPKALEITLGLIKYEHRPLQQVIDNLYAARGDLFDDLFTRAWALLDEAARHVLLVMSFFPASASAEALAATAEVQGYYFERAVERLSDLALLDVQQVDLNSVPRYVLHPLVQSFVSMQLAKSPQFEEKARERWVAWYLALTSKVGFCWGEIDKLDLLDLEREMIDSVAIWAFNSRRYAEILQIGKDVNYYDNIRAFRSKGQSVHFLQIEAARILQDTASEMEALAFLIHTLSARNQMSEAEMLIVRLKELCRSNALNEDSLLNYQRAISIYSMACGDYDTAQKGWLASRDLAEKLSIPLYVSNCYYLAVCMHKLGKPAEAQDILHVGLTTALKHKYTRNIIAIPALMAEIYIDQGDLEKAEALLGDCINQAHHYRTFA